MALYSREGEAAYRVLWAKHQARAAVRRAVRAGRLVKQPCPCGERKVEAHHALGYGWRNRLDVVWLCRLHHRRQHTISTRAGDL